MSDLIAVLTWWILIQIFGLVALPLAFRLFRRLPDRGYGFSKALGLLLAGYIFWLLGVLGFLRNDNGGIIFSLITAATISLLLYRHPHTPNTQYPISLSYWLRANWKLVLFTEALFAFTFFGWALYRAYIPRIMTSGGEKFMELMFLNGIQRSATLPPHDPWLSGYAISYYYFGYLIVSMLIRLSGVATAVGFNLGGALLFALTATGAFSLVYNLVASDKGQGARARVRPLSGVFRPAVGVALLGVVFIVLLSNFEGPLEVAHWKGLGSEGFWRWLDIADLNQPPPDSTNNPSVATRLTRSGWWWWRASRVIFDYDLKDWPRRYDETADPPPHARENISEFPFFSFLHGDIHPHVLALPYILLTLAASLSLFEAGSEISAGIPGTCVSLQGIPVGQGKCGGLGDESEKIPESPNPGPFRLGNWELVLWALIFGAVGFLNAWDLPFLWAIAIVAYALGRLTNQPAQRANQPTNILTNLRPHLRPILTLSIVLAAGSLLLYAPFYIGFQSQASGVLAHVHSSTRLAQFGVMFGPLLVILIAFLAWGIVRAARQGTLAWRNGLWTAATLLLIALGILVVTALLIALSPHVRDLVAPGLAGEEPTSIALRYLSMRLSAPGVTLLLAGMVGVAVVLLLSPGFSRVTQFSLILVAAGAGMTLLPEYVYIKDVFGVRLNTIFKFYHLAWVVWAIAAAGAIYTMLIAKDGLQPVARWLFGGGLALVIGLGLIYPLAALPDRVKEFPEAPTLDGTVYLEQFQPADYAATRWLSNYVQGPAVILETHSTGAYAYEGRVSTLTGLPTLVGWGHHEWQWRGNMDEQNKRYPVIQELYSTSDPQRTLTLLDEYDITYVYVGPLERNQWPESGLRKFDLLMDTVYEHDGVTIYKRREPPGGGGGE
jgi:YYY domain-containing protein